MGKKPSIEQQVAKELAASGVKNIKADVAKEMASSDAKNIKADIQA